MRYRKKPLDASTLGMGSYDSFLKQAVFGLLGDRINGKGREAEN
jgi:hypothetical protein